MNTAPTKIDFIESHQPSVETGKYKISIEQTVKIEGQQKLNPKITKNFYVAGERFHLLPDHIHSVFPPAHSLGEHSNVFPHLMLSRNTLPWERESVPGDANTPWLALLVIHEGEEAQATISTATLGDLKTASTESPYFLGLSLEPGQIDSDKVAILDIEKSLLEQILPDKNTLRFMTHIRQGKDDEGNIVGEDIAVIVAHRLPEKGKSTTVHLVSLEDRYTTGDTFNYQGAQANDKIRFVKLHSWTFTCTDPQGDFANLLKHLNRETTTLRLPDVNNSDTDAYLQTGFYPLPHKMRQGTQTVSWYHGPLAPKSNEESFDFPAKGSDALLRYYKNNGMFDVSYASAWELGRLLALQNTHFSTELYQWKRRYAQCSNKQTQTNGQETGHLKGENCDHTSEALPASLKNWLTDLEHLKGVPFNYLVPDEKLLPVESIRFFQLDKLWVKSLLDGAFSVGRVTSKDHALDEEIVADEQTLTAREISGFILRSEVVSGWPGMQIEGFNSTPTTGNEEQPLPDSTKLSIVRSTKLSKNVLLCLFEGDLQTLDLHLKPEVLHFGVIEKEGGGYKKELRDEQGLEHSNYTIDVPIDGNLILNLNGLLSGVQSEYDNNSKIAWTVDPTSANLALQLIEGVERVRFVKATE